MCGSVRVLKREKGTDMERDEGELQKMENIDQRDNWRMSRRMDGQWDRGEQGCPAAKDQSATRAYGYVLCGQMGKWPYGQLSIWSTGRQGQPSQWATSLEQPTVTRHCEPLSMSHDETPVRGTGGARSNTAY